jgi:hypothetical protein
LLRICWPEELVSHVSDPDNGIAFKCDVAIYVRKVTCERPTEATITFAHELQHFMQYGRHYQEWLANSSLVEVASPEMLDPKPWDFPCEHEAQLVSKRVAEAILGSEEVGRYASEEIRSGNDPQKWTFFQGLDTSQEYDFAENTRQMERTFKGKLDALYRKQCGK